MKCTNCPRECESRDTGFCGETKIRVAKIIKNFMWEEPCLSEDGVTAIFFSGCNLKCVFCQNYEISLNDEKSGEEYTSAGFAKLLAELDELGKPLDFISPSQFTAEILEAFKIYTPENRVIWNSNAYEKGDAIFELTDYVSVFLPDFKFADNNIALEYAKTDGYFDVATEALLEMRGKEDIFEDGVLKEGLLVRHLVLPGATNNSFKVLQWIKENLGEETYVSVMSQYTPTPKVKFNPKLNRPVSKLEYNIVKSYAMREGFVNGFFQSGESQSESFIPDFGKTAVRR